MYLVAENKKEEKEEEEKKQTGVARAQIRNMNSHKT